MIFSRSLSREGSKTSLDLFLLFLLPFKLNFFVVNLAICFLFWFLIRKFNASNLSFLLILLFAYRWSVGRRLDYKTSFLLWTPSLGFFLLTQSPYGRNGGRNSEFPFDCFRICYTTLSPFLSTPEILAPFRSPCITLLYRWFISWLFLLIISIRECILLIYIYLF